MKRVITILILVLLTTVVAQGQIKIGGNVYGGGNKGEVKGSTKVTVHAGDIGVRPKSSDEPLEDPAGKVFGGARMANVGGNAYVNINGAEASGDIIINHVYGGNDIAGTIGTAAAVGEALPTELEDNPMGVDNTWNAYVHISTKTETKDGVEKEADDAKKVYIGQLFGGGNGDYTYTDENGDDLTDENGNYIVRSGDQVIATKATPFNTPELAKTFIDLHGGSIVYAYGGGNNATVTEKAVICVNNPSKVVNSIADVEDQTELLSVARFKDMGINTGYSHPSSDAFQIGSLFGGNNKADMAIRPTWNLQSGKVRNLYSGGNRGRMIYEKGLFLEIPASSTLVVDNLYGGCRMADVRPMRWDVAAGQYVDVDDIHEVISGYSFPANLAARLIIQGGDINNVYGGNDVRGKVYFGNAIGIRTSIRGNVYGGGNGSYPYTDMPNMVNDDVYGDLVYSEGEEGASTSIEALNSIRPDAEQVSIKVRGTEEKKTIIGGAIYVGGNSATLKTMESHKNLPNYPLTELKIGSYVIADSVFLGNNGEHMVSEEILKLYAQEGFTSLDLTDQSVFADYMSGVSLSQVPRLVIESKEKGDDYDYIPYTSYIGSLFYGSNRGSMTYSGPIDITPNAPIYIYNKLVAGCNNANIAASQYNARYEGGILGSASEQQEGGYLNKNGKIKDRVEMNLSKIRLLPMRLNSTKTALEWNTVESDGVTTLRPELSNGIATDADKGRRLLGGNIYGGCCQSGHVNGNVVINVKGSLLDRHQIFDVFEGEEEGDNILYDYDSYNITKRNSGVILNEQGMDVLGEALSVYGGGKGAETEIWGSTTVNIEKGYAFQVFGGSENGVIGKKKEVKDEHGAIVDYVYTFDPVYSTTVNLNGSREGASRADDSSEEMADVEFIYGGGNNGLILGNTRVNLDNGRLFNAFAGSCNADILGHTETYVGLNGFPYLRDHIYGGNDLGGEIKGLTDFSGLVRDYEEDKTMIHGYNAATPDAVPDVLKANTYVEYRQGNMKGIFGGCFGDYDYENEFTIAKGYSIPKLNNTFVNFRPDDNSKNHVDKVFGAGEGYPGFHGGDKMQNRSYVLVDIADNKDYYANTEVFGGGENNGLGMAYTYAQTTDAGFDLDNASAIIDLMRGKIGAAYGGSYSEGVTRRTVVNVPTGSTININNIFGGAYGTNALPPCDVYESNVNYRSDDAIVSGAIFGGNNKVRRTLYSKVNIFSTVYNGYSNAETGERYLGTVFGAGYGAQTWAEYTEVNLEPGAKVYEVYGGGKLGQVLNAESIQQYMQAYINPQADDDLPPHIQGAHVDANWLKKWKDAWSLGDYYTPNDAFDDYISNGKTNLSNDKLVRTAEMDMRTTKTNKYNTNVIINEGATVTNYAYGGGLGNATVPNSGDVIGSTYITLLGGTVNKDIYAAGTTGSVYNYYGSNFTATANAYIRGGMVRNVYGGGWRGSVGYHKGLISDVANNATDRNGETHVVIGDLGSGKDFLNGDPAIMRNVYGGGEGGGIFGTANVYVNNGHIGYRYKNTAAEGAPAQYQYVAELDDKAEGDSLLYKSGNVFGGGYVANSYVDHSSILMYDGTVRGSLYGGGEVGPIGRGTMKADAPGTVSNGTAKVYKPGTTRLEMYGGHVLRNVFGGGRGHDNWDGEGYMTDAEKLTMDRSAKGYVFGQTLVHIHGGEIGTEGGLAENSGNVFGGGDYGYVCSAYENGAGVTCYGKKNGSRYDNGDEGYYYKYENNAFENVDGEKVLTEDCKVLIEPQTKVISDVTINGHDWTSGQYAPIEDLNTLRNKKDDEDRWNCLDPTGIIIHNAVFAGGNTVQGSIVNANTVTVYGNATASIHDIYHRDLITLGTNHIGGLYGDGNLTLVDGYRGLNITNYGTDYYSIDKEISIDTYRALPEREAAYYELKYKCLMTCTDKDGTRYNPSTEENGVTTKASTITADDMMVLFLDDNGQSVQVDAEGNRVTSGGTAILTKVGDKWVPNTNYWEESGVLPIYAGRLMNSIQRADFCGVFGSRMVMRGAQDRVPEVADFTNYTINRVREVSLNQQHSVIPEDLALKTSGTTRRETGTTTEEDQDPDNYADLDKAIHGNYFGIYNIVNYLGALTSDVHFMADKDKRRTSNTNDGYKPSGDGDDVTYYQWKSKHIKDRKRNNGTSLNKVALASGVYLELTTEKSTGDGLKEKDWGYITGVIELDLINVQTGIGGGFVYAKNEHGTATYTPKKHVTLTELNKDAVTRKDFTYSASGLNEWETSGNFVHSTQTIIDDCYNISGKYEGDDAVPAHYWYIKGQVYVYDQYISAYTGTPNAYSETVEIPLTITAASHGSMKLVNIMPNRYAYYASPGVPLELGKKVNINDVDYYKNTPISYWDWNLLSNTEKELFVEKTYVTNDSCKIGNTFYPPGYVMLPDEYESLRDAATTQTIDHEEVKAVMKATKDENGNDMVVKDNDGKTVYKAFDFVFRESNNMGHNTGYILTYKVNNPTEWDTWYTPQLDSDGSKIDLKTYKDKSVNDKEKYENGPTYRLISKTGEVLGQRKYKEGDLISKDVWDTYQAIPEAQRPTTGQATFGEAYLVTKQITENDEETGGTHHLNPGAAVPASYATSHSGSVEKAYICTSTIPLGSADYIYLDTRMTETEYLKYKQDYPSLANEIDKYVVPAYICTNEEGGLYGGNYYESGKNYRGLEAWSSMTKADRAKFIFNYDALDVLIDPLYSKDENGTVIHPEGQKYQYDGNYTSEEQVKDATTGNKAGYSVAKPVDYTATYNGTTALDYTKDDNTEGSATNGTELSRTEYERLVNEQRHYTLISSTKIDNVYKAYVVNTSFQVGNTPFAVGESISATEYSSLSEDNQAFVTTLTLSDQSQYYYCREAYTIDGTNGNPVYNIANNTGYAKGTTVPKGAVIEATSTAEGYTGYNSLTNNQKNFTIHGIAPTEVSTLFVSRESDIFDLSTEKIITVIYEYNYEESDTNGNTTPVSERHVVNIHVTFKSGVPTVEDIKAPQIVLPGDYVEMISPRITPGAYEVTGSGWELFESKDNAESHTNGVEYTPHADPLYYNQNGHYLAYYAKTYLGKTYSNHVPVSVANYHDLKKVVEAKEHHYYVDDPNVKREPKIYINDYSQDETGSKNGLDLLKSLFDLSVLSNPEVDTEGLIKSGTFQGHKPLGSRVAGAKNLEFFLRTDIDHSATSGSSSEPSGSSSAPSGSAAWTPIGETTCFEGTLHGDGHTISGLDHSLFGRLCGDVYNLGVSGTFTGAGIAESGDGYVENCWISTSSTEAKTAKPVFGEPTRVEGHEKGTVQIVNCYYQEDDAATNKYTNHAANSINGTPIRKDTHAFYSGEVAYDLNGFYLYKRYSDHTALSALSGSATEYKYWQSGNTEPQTGHYGQDATLCSAGYGKYVEDRFADGDFIYAGGSIPSNDDKRLYTYTVTDESGNDKIVRDYYPVWPDDYLFFGQTLNYGYATSQAHQDVPSSYTASNRVFRAPAYFRSSVMKAAHFNPSAVFAQADKNDNTKIAYKDMTAIDFTGSNGDVTGGYKLGLQETASGGSAANIGNTASGGSAANIGNTASGGSAANIGNTASGGSAAGIEGSKFYPPLLDNDGLTGFLNADLTKNLLVYTGSTGGTGADETPTADQQTANVVSDYLEEPAYTESVDGYRCVAYQNPNNLHGHWVENGIATRNHFLADKQDFNAPIAYTFASDKRMWYQRQPAATEYVERTKGWQGISLPFTAELVTTQQKGEITHFYSGSYESKDDTPAKIGHEYWLRELSGEAMTLKSGTTDVLEATFNYPGGTENVTNKTVTNTFLWDYYYKGVAGGHSQKDWNKDTYQEYYKASRTYDNYSLLTGGKPYLLGLPGVTYYEFDLSGSFEATTTTTPYPVKLDAQTITFASEPGTTIHVSDDEMTGSTATYDSKTFSFKPNYLNNPELETGKHAFLLNDEGSGYVEDKTARAANVYAFRPYFIAPVANEARETTRSIVFGNAANDSFKTGETNEPGTLEAHDGPHKVIVSSTLKYITEVRIVNAAGLTFATFTIKPGETVETRIINGGVYIVQDKEGLYIKKLMVK